MIFIRAYFVTSLAILLTFNTCYAQICSDWRGKPCSNNEQCCSPNTCSRNKLLGVLGLCVAPCSDWRGKPCSNNEQCCSPNTCRIYQGETGFCVTPEPCKEEGSDCVSRTDCCAPLHCSGIIIIGNGQSNYCSTSAGFGQRGK